MDLRCILKVCGMGNQKTARTHIVKLKCKGLFEVAPLSKAKQQAMAEILPCK